MNSIRLKSTKVDTNIHIHKTYSWLENKDENEEAKQRPKRQSIETKCKWRKMKNEKKGETFDEKLVVIM